jgi:transketolase
LKYGIENSNGSLGIGLWQAYGNAIDCDSTVYCLAGDGEFQEPLSLSIFAAATNLRPAGNFILLVNNNELAQDSKIDIGPLLEVAKSFNWQTSSVDGHNITAIGEAIQYSVENLEKPSIIICKTVKGKDGDPALAGKLGNHGKPPKTEEEYLAHIEGLKQSRRN